MFKEYNNQVQLVLRCLPTVSKMKNFALTGGTAINMFVQQQYPRLSVDIDLTYLPVQGRNESILAIDQDLVAIGETLKREFRYKIEHCRNPATKSITKIKVNNNVTKITIEPNLILRGTVYPIIHKDLSKKVADLYGAAVPNMPLVAVEELYAGKICAALDRQHPRDLFDIKFILEEGISERTKIAFLIYLMSNNRPMFELLAPNRLDQRKAYEEEFQGMTDLKLSYEELENIREQLISTIKNILNEQDKQFLLSVKKGTPNWDHIQIPNVENLPSIKWKLQNLNKMDTQKAKDYLAKLEAALYD
jgi:predicted nucleotidyltransferase component of viral defense system